MRIGWTYQSLLANLNQGRLLSSPVSETAHLRFRMQLDRMMEVLTALHYFVPELVAR